MLKSFLLILSLTTLPVSAFAKSEVVSQVVSKTDSYKVTAELYYDKEAKKADLWVDYLQGSTEDDRIAFKATSLPEKLKDADIKLIAHPITRFEGRTTVIYNGFSADGAYNGNRGMALLFKFPLEELAGPTVRTFMRHFPGSIGYDPSGKPRYIKAVLCRITEYQVFPIAAFDVELNL